MEGRSRLQSSGIVFRHVVMAEGWKGEQLEMKERGAGSRESLLYVSFTL